ncbi:SAM-dependent methyltransferase [Amycolatopsis suaedae]|uniref:SAM-dependent methyltransferase n=1 Tax=Amycolatopsis suaedae TaxID=2510978 RepID=A0A4Q7JGE8_9PSEU|nr:SAM-dependent methyltransferase [Amycolatopsis suaedae]RZQ65854.1 SAM-dependent methyltransferase [Amycolatopsis suaedae]
MSETDWLPRNRENWDDRVRVHAASEFYDLPGFLAGASTLLADRASFATADVYDAPEVLAGQRFDIVYTGIGALVWLPDLTRWARVVTDLLADGGFVYLAELHPVTDVLDDDGTTVTHDYFRDGGETYDDAHTYTDGPPLTSTASTQWQHPLGEVVTALARAGLRIEFLHEHPFSLFERFPGLERGESGEYRFPAGRPRVPLLYSIRASA